MVRLRIGEAQTKGGRLDISETMVWPNYRDDMSAQCRKVVPPNFRFTPLSSGLFQRTCACGNHTMAGGECEECKKRQTLQRACLPRGRGTKGEGDVPPIIHEVLRSPGQPLDPATCTLMEPGLGHDFSGVPLHTDARAVNSARAVDALVLKMLWGRKLVCRWSQSAGNSLSQLSRLCVRNSA
jgi:hypothetical protein